MFFSIRMLVRWWVSDQSKDGLFRHRYLIKYLWFRHIEIAKRFYTYFERFSLCVFQITVRALILLEGRLSSIILSVVYVVLYTCLATYNRRLLLCMFQTNSKALIIYLKGA